MAEGRSLIHRRAKGESLARPEDGPENAENGGGPGKASASPERLPRRVERRIALARATLLWEALWPALWRAAALTGFFVSLALFGLFEGAPLWLHWLALAAFGVLLALAIWRGFRDFRWPTRHDALRQIETASGLSHRPLSTFEDMQAGGTGDETLWRAHRDWLSRRLSHLRIGLPAPRIAGQDPFGLRAAVVLLLLVAVWAGGRDAGPRLTSAFLPGASLSRDIAIEAWISPPPYTGIPPIYLTGDAAPGDETGGASGKTAIAVPQGSVLSLRVNGMRAYPALSVETGKRAEPEPLTEISPGSHSIDRKLTQSAEITLTGAGRIMDSWTVDVTPDEAPYIAFKADPETATSGAIGISYIAKDDYGIATAQADIRLEENKAENQKGDGTEKSAADDPQLNAIMDTLMPPAPTVAPPDIRLPLSGARPKEADGRTWTDLRSHPWAGLKATMTLVATDDAGQQGHSRSIDFTIPQRSFKDPLARAIVEQRRQLARNPRSTARVARFLNAFTHDPEKTISDPAVYMGLRTAYWRLATARRTEEMKGIYDLLWSIALRIEDGDLSLAERDLRDAQKALSDALQQGASDDEIARLMAELKQAFDSYMNALTAQQGKTADEQMEFPSEERSISREELDRMLGNIGELARSGSREQAQAMLQRMQSILENLQLPKQAGQMSPGDKAMSEAVDRMGDLIRRQQELMDETFRRQPQQQGLDAQGMPQEGMPQGGMPQGMPEPGEEGQGGMSRHGEDGGNAPDLQGLAAEQKALREELAKILKMLERNDAETPDALAEADKSMEDAQGRLKDGRADRATASQGKAIDQMRAGAQGLADKLMKGRGGKGRGKGTARTDPFGRPSPGAMDRGEGVNVPDRSGVQQAREILQELRRRAGELNRPQEELDYLDRLLKRY
ncbi:MAG: TIGR02302 family protein [Parvibaculum sp.]|nr:TIGR02302 family protein [Parvibaculum sp.]